MAVYKMMSIHGEIDFAYRRGHLWEAARFIGSDNLGWFDDEHYNTGAVVLFNADQLTVEQAKEMFEPYRGLECADWVSEYRDEHGFPEEVAYDLADQSATGVYDMADDMGIEDVVADASGDILWVTHCDTQYVRDHNEEVKDVVEDHPDLRDLEYTLVYKNRHDDDIEVQHPMEGEDVDMYFWREGTEEQRGELRGKYPEYLWGDVERAFWYQTNGNKKEGIINVADYREVA